MGDKIIIKNLLVRNVTGVDSWERLKRQPVLINLTLNKNISKAGEKDKLTYSINYGTVSKAVSKFAEDSICDSVEVLAEGIAKICVNECHAPRVTVRVEKPRALLHAASAGVEIIRTKEDYDHVGSNSNTQPNYINSHQDLIFIKDLRLSAIIGVNPWEREEKQTVILNLTIYSNLNVNSSQNDAVTKPHNYRTIVRTISKYVEESTYQTVEAFAITAARIAITQCLVDKVTVRVEKPSALVFAESAGIEITRSQSDFADEARHISQPQLDFLNGKRFRNSRSTIPEQAEVIKSTLPKEYKHFAFIGLGSNLGDRVKNINEALQQLEKICKCKVLDTSFLYETSPMYVIDQPNFLNAACKIATNLNPEELIKELQAVELNLGRSRENAIRNGPRTIDLDILFYDDIECSTDTLVIPHPLMHEREFVLRPLCDIAKRFEHPKLYKTCEQLLSQYLKSPNYDKKNTIYKVLPIQNSKWIWNSKTYIMGVINVTPDSFSDGGQFYSVESAVSHAENLIAEGADILDIGGMSTRPNADEIPIEEEIARVIPVIQAIRSKGITDIPISIDTYRATVAEKAIAAGANLINDVSGGQLDSDMYRIMAKMNVPICLQHTRGNSKTMTKLTQYEDIITDICSELFERVEKAIEAGVKRWNIIIDPGIGFAKNYEQSFQILKRLHELTGRNSPFEGFPCLVGPSRKGFIGDATKQPDAKKRGWGSAAACTASIAGGADVLRVHDVKEMVDVAKVSDRIWRCSLE
ncbi:237_t:CDS:2 [Dentiscutata erythropus]|uniref:Folic acid synthesis protein FOL1 n=1 Tax=Dentiscutata erythropus TaxID=1348616 RepID=A0A9N8VV72_9GLOM|nr:237_t:CDS:2 [Dentiscutata erythropus]